MTVPAPAQGATRLRQGRWAAALRTPVGVAAAVLLTLVAALAVLGPVLLGHRAGAVDTDHVLEGSSGAHWVGTDGLGRDLFARVLVATRLSVELALLATLIAVVLGLLLGSAPVLLGRRAGRLVTAAVNIAVAFPGLLLALFFAVVLGVGMTGSVLAIGLAGAPSFARRGPGRRGTDGRSARLTWSKQPNGGFGRDPEAQRTRRPVADGRARGGIGRRLRPFDGPQVVASEKAGPATRPADGTARSWLVGRDGPRAAGARPAARGRGAVGGLSARRTGSLVGRGNRDAV